MGSLQDDDRQPRGFEAVSLRLPNEASTEALGGALAEALAAGDVILLEGDLGAGKTTLIRAVARSLGVPEDVAVTSPTFNLVHEYPEARVPVVHADLYRIGEPGEVAELGLDDAAASAAVLVEWGLRFRDVLPVPAVLIELAWRLDDAADSRVGVARAYDLRGRELLSALRASGATAELG